MGKRHFAPTFHYDLPEEMFVTISRHTKTYMIFGMTKILNKQGVRNESPDFLTVFYILSTISFRFPCIFFNYDLLTNMCYGLPVNVFKGKNQFRTPEQITGCPGHLVRNVFVHFKSTNKVKPTMIFLSQLGQNIHKSKPSDFEF